MTRNLSLSPDFKSNAGVIKDKKKTGNIKGHIMFDNRRVSRGMPRIGLISMIIVGLLMSTRSLKLENEEGEVIYDDTINTSLKVIGNGFNDSRTLGDDLWDIAKIVGKGIGQVFPQMHEEIIPERKDQLTKEIEALGEEMKKLRKIYDGEKEKIEEVRKDKEILWRDIKEATDKEKDIRKLVWNPDSIECLIDPHEETVFQGIGVRFYENIFKRLVQLVPKINLPNNWVGSGNRYLKYRHVEWIRWAIGILLRANEKNINRQYLGELPEEEIYDRILQIDDIIKEGKRIIEEVKSRAQILDKECIVFEGMEKEFKIKKEERKKGIRIGQIQEVKEEEKVQGLNQKTLEIMTKIEEKILQLKKVDEEEKGCKTFQCSLSVVTGGIYKWSWIALSNPVGFAIQLAKEVVSVYKEQIKYILSIIGFLISFMIMNMMAYIMIKINNVYEKSKKVAKSILNLPIITMTTKILKKGAELLDKPREKEDITRKLDEKMDEKLKAVTDAMQKIKDEIRKAPKLAMTKCEYCGSSAHNLRNCPVRRMDENRQCAYCGKRGHLAYQCEKRKLDEAGGYKPWEILEPRPPKEIRKQSDSWIVCRHCGRRGHKESECWIKAKEERYKAGPSNVAAKKPPLFPKPPKKVANVINDINVEERKEIYAPINFEGVRFSRCLIDTGAQINLMPASDVTKNQFIIQKGGIQEVRGFNGSPGKIVGTIKGKLQVGPEKEAKETDFLVSPDITVPVIGFPALREFGLSIDCQNHQIYNESTGEAVLCSVIATKSKN